MRVGKLWTVSDEEFLNAVKQSACFSDVVRFFGLSASASNHLRYVKERMKLLGCEFGVKMTHRGSKPCKHTLDELLVEDSDFDDTRALKKRLLKANLLEYKCGICGNTGVWQGKPLVLVLDHINGNKRDNRLENLRLVCPNCDSQSPTYRGRNKREFAYRSNKADSFCKTCGVKISRGSTICEKCHSIEMRRVERPEKETLLALVKEKSFDDVGSIYGVSGTSIRKWLKYYGLPTRKKDIEQL